MTVDKEDQVAMGSAPVSEQSFCTRVIYTGLVALILLAPLPLGSARPLAWDVLGLAVGLLLLGSSQIPANEASPFPRDLWVPGILLAAVLVFALVQISTLTPAYWHSPLWEEASEALARPVHGSIAVDRQAELVDLFRFCIYAGIFYLAHSLGHEPKRVRDAMRLVCFGGTAYAAYGLVVYGTGNDTLLWFHKWAYRGDLTSTFVNRNSFATYMGLCVLVTLCLAGTAFKEPAGIHGTWREKLRLRVEFLSRRAWVFACLFLQATALLLTHSRGGTLSTVAGGLALVVALSQAPSLGRARYLGLIALPVLALLVAFLISGETFLARLADSDQTGEGRLAIAKLTAQAIRDYPILGTGLGSFASVFPIYRTDVIPTGFVNATHNDYLENLLELGIPVAVALFGAVIWLAGLCARGLRVRRRNAVFPCLGVAATTLVGIHATVDFSLQIPAVTALYMFLMGIAVAQSRSTSNA